MRSSTARVALNVAAMLGAFVRDWLTFVGLSVAMLACAGAKDSDVFPFYVDAHLVDVMLLVSAGPALTFLLLRIATSRWSLRHSLPAPLAMPD